LAGAQGLFTAKYGKIKIAQWRNDDSGPMCVVSGTYDREKIHYEAPAADRLDDEMLHFLTLDDRGSASLKF
jgi:hypothetical protein